MTAAQKVRGVAAARSERGVTASTGGQGPARLRRLVVIPGAMKSGTSTLFTMLARSPRICPCAEKEPKFFSGLYQWPRGWDWYEGLFAGYDPDRHDWALDGTTDYAKLPYLDFALDRLAAAARTGLEVRAIYIMRDPIERIEKHHAHAALTGFELMQHHPGRYDFSFDAGGPSEVAVDISRYAHHLDAYAAALGPERVLPVVFERLRADPDGELARVADFLGIPAVAADGLAHANARERMYKSPTWKRLRAVAPLRAAVRLAVPRPLRHRTWAAMAARENAVARGRFTLNPAERAEVVRRLASDLVRLRDVWGIDPASFWGVDPAAVPRRSVGV